MRRPPASLGAYELLLRGRALHDRTTEAGTLRAREMLARAIAADPGYALAHAWQAFTVQRGFSQWWGEPRGPAALPPALALVRRAVELEPDSPRCVAVLGYVLLLCRRWDEALETARAAVRMNPGAPWGRASYGEALIHAGGDPEEAVRETRLSLALDPFHPPRLRHQLGRALLLAGRPEEASSVLNTNAGDIYFEFEVSGLDFNPALALDESATNLGFAYTADDPDAYCKVVSATFENTGDFYMALTFDGDILLSAQFYNNQDLLDLAAAGEPGWHDVLADGVRANHARTGTWYIGAVPDDEPGPTGPTDWNALAAEAQARFEATGQCGLLSYDAADDEWGIL